MKKLLSLITIAFLMFNLSAQDAVQDSTKWKFGGITSLAFSQVSLYQWAAGGEASFSGAGLFNVYANYKDENTSWINTLEMGYGLIKQGDLTKKSNDRIEFTSQFGKKASEKWFYSAMLNFKTQFADGYNYPNDSVAISTFFAPAYLTGSIGMDYKPNDKLQIFISPITSKLTFVMDDTLSAAGNFGVEAGEKFRAELGGYVKIGYATALMENVDLKTRIDMFSNYMKTNELKDVDVNWELLITMKINEFLSATLNTLMIWDNDITVLKEDGTSGTGVQFKEVFGLGLSYKF